MMTEKHRVNRCLFLRCARRREFLSKLRLFCLRTRLWISLALREQLQGIFTSKTMKWMTCWCTPSQTTAFCSHEKSYTFRRWRHDLHWILKALNTDFELCINNVFPTVHNKLLRHSKVRNISQHSKESTWTNIEITSFSTEKNFWGRQIYKQEKSIFPPLPYYNCVLSNANIEWPEIFAGSNFRDFCGFFPWSPKIVPASKKLTPLTKLSAIQSTHVKSYSRAPFKMTLEREGWNYTWYFKDAAVKSQQKKNTTR